MSNKRRNRKTAKGARHGVMGRARAQMKLAANVTEEQDWYLDTPDVRLTRIFTVVLLLHAIAIGGIVAFKMVDKASATTSITISSARETFENAVREQKALASEVPDTAAVSRPEIEARPKPAAPLRLDPASENQYKVLAGDKLPDIAKAHNVSVEALRKENSIVSDNELYPGRVLSIPTGPTATAVATAEPVVENRAPGNGDPAYYTVKKGDTAWGIAREFQVSFNRLMQENGVDRPESLQIGQRLRIPAAN